jgi:alcohol dehydrogenase class IV
MRDFIYEALPQRVVFGWGTLDTLPAEVERLGACRALVLTTPNQAERGRQLAASLGSRAAGSCAGAVMHTPVAATETAMAQVRELDVDLLVAFGGGSAIGLAKAIALRTGLPQIAIPTTYAGSEATPVAGETAGGRKTTVRDPRVLPKVIVYDVSLTMTLGAATTTSGFNAIAHAVEALYARDRNPIVAWLAEKGVELLAGALPVLHRAPQDRDARTAALLGAYACGACLGMSGMALHHRICHTLGGAFGLPHAATHTVVLPHAVAYNERAARQELAPVARILGAPSAAAGLWSLAVSLDAPMKLSALGLKEADLDEVASLALQSPFWNPQPLVREEVRALVEHAFTGRWEAPGQKVV